MTVRNLVLKGRGVDHNRGIDTKDLGNGPRVNRNYFLLLLHGNLGDVFIWSFPFRGFPMRIT